jgi:erythromycin esterase-like protein
MSARGERNAGQLMQERLADEVFLIGFTTYSGEVTAASQWEAPAERKIVRPALEGSYEALFHQTGIPAFLLSLRDRSAM